MRKILFLVCCGNFLFAVSYLVGGSGLNGAASSLLASIVSIVNYFFDLKNRSVPKWLMVIYAVAFIVLNVWIGGMSPLSLLVIVSSLAFVVCIGQKDGAKYRFCVTFNLLLLCVYDLLSVSYGVFSAHLVQLAFNVIGMLMHDKKSQCKKV